MFSLSLCGDWSRKMAVKVSPLILQGSVLLAILGLGVYSGDPDGVGHDVVADERARLDRGYRAG